MTLADFLEKLRTDSATKVLDEIYRTDQGTCVGFMMKQRGLKKPEAEDIFIEALIILIENAEAGKISPSSAKVSTYLIEICKNTLLNTGQKSKRERLLLLLGIHLDTETDENFETTVHLLEKCLALLKDAAQQLVDYWLKGLQHHEIARLMGYSGADTSKARFWQVTKGLGKCIEERRQQADSQL